MGQPSNTANTWPSSSAPEGELVAFATEGDVFVDGTIEPEVAPPKSSRSFRSKCPDLLSLPQAVRDMEWNDPFYANDKDVIAAFDIDYSGLELALKAEQAKRVNLMLVVTRLCLVLVAIVWFSLASDPGLDFIFFMSLMGLLAVCTCGCVAYPWSCYTVPTKEMMLCQLRHVAINRHGVCLDDANEPQGLNLARRQVIPFDTIAKCSVTEVGYFRPSYRVVIELDPAQFTETSNWGRITIRGLYEQQAFVDVVNALMKNEPTVLCSAV